MRLNGSLALRVAVVVAAGVASANAFAGGLFDCSLFKKPVPTTEFVSDGGFFDGQAITLGDMGPSFDDSFAYEGAEVEGFYGECASCSGDAPVVDGGYVAGGIPAAVSYAYPVASYVAPTSCATWRPGLFSRVPGYGLFRGGLINSVKRFLGFRSYDYCQPAYVCDPCWNVCDPCWNTCDPCWSPCCVDACNPCAVPCNPCNACAPVCAPACAPIASCAPVSCCAGGAMPGQINALNPETGLPAGGIDAAPKAAPAPKAVSTDVDVPSYDSNDSGYESGVDSGFDSTAPEAVPTPAADPKTGAGVLKMLVPEDSVVYVNGYRTKQRGAVRSFVARQLEYGESYTFEIRVVAMRDGRAYEDVQTATLTAGDSSALAFNPTLRDDEAIAYK